MSIKFAIPKPYPDSAYTSLDLVKSSIKDRAIISQEDCSMTVNGLNIQGSVIEVEPLDDWPQETEPYLAKLASIVGRPLAQFFSLTTTATVVGGNVFPFFGSTHLVSVSMTVNTPKEKNEANRYAIAQEAYTEALLKFSAITGTRVNVFARDQGQKDPLADTPGVYNIFLNTAPTGERNSHHASKVFGMYIEKVERYYFCQGPTPGRGEILYDDSSEDKTPIIQIVGNNFYFLVPCLSTFSGQSKRIFEKLLTTAWNYGYKNSDKPRIVVGDYSESLMVEIEDWENPSSKISEDSLRELDEEIAKIQENLSVKLSHRALWNKMRKAMLASKVPSTASEDFQRLQNDPRIDKIGIHEDGIMVLTQEIHAEFEKEKYNLGTFGIRISKGRTLSLWSEESQHPIGFPHPHMPANSTPCFGNATRAIEEATAEFRWADAITFVLDWLIYGYAPELALTKIEEWPVIGELEFGEIEI